MNFEESIKINATPQKIFSLYKDVNNWKVWDKEVQESSLNGEFIEGTTGSLTPKKGPKVKIVLSKVKENELFISDTKLPLCVMSFEHRLTPDDNMVLVTHKVTFSGVFSFIFSRLIGKSIKHAFPETLKGLKDSAEKEDV